MTGWSLQALRTWTLKRFIAYLFSLSFVIGVCIEICTVGTESEKLKVRIGVAD
jgi:hypothetical protein